jgi:hypothetical protein
MQIPVAIVEGLPATKVVVLHIIALCVMWVLESSTYLQQNCVFMGRNVFTASILYVLILCSLWSEKKWRYFELNVQLAQV